MDEAGLTGAVPMSARACGARARGARSETPVVLRHHAI